MMIINGKTIQAKELRLKDYIKEQNLKMEFIALELNGRILPREEFEHIVLKENDKVEIVSFVGGG